MRKKIDYLDRNPEHRVKRAEALHNSKPGEKVMVDGIEYFKPKRACVNCIGLQFKNGDAWCSSFHKVIKNIVKNRDSCEFWVFNEG